MNMNPPARRAAFITPLGREDLLDPGEIFPREELARRVLSFFWRDCCCPSCFSRAPAPVIEVVPGPPVAGGELRPLRAWWLLDDGILEESDGPYSELFRSYFEASERSPQLCPRYEFCTHPEPLAVEMRLHHTPFSFREHRVHLVAQPDGRVRIAAHEPVSGA
jgi:hypothetical protein